MSIQKLLVNELSVHVYFNSNRDYLLIHDRNCYELLDFLFFL